MAAYSEEYEPVYTQEQMNSVINGIKNMFGLQVEANTGTMIVRAEDYNKLVKIITDL